MSGFLGSNVSMTICSVEEPHPLTPELLRKGAFTEVIDPEGKRFGWTGMGELLDTDNFFLSIEETRFCGFSYRIDSKKPSSAVIRLQIAEKIRDEEKQNGKIGAKRKKEIREQVIENLTLQCDFAPALIDCIWDMEKNRLYIASTSIKLADRILAHFKASFGMDAVPLVPEKDMSEVFSKIQYAGGAEIDGIFLEPIGSANLQSSPQSSEKQAIAILNSHDAISQALTCGMNINKIRFLAKEPGTEEEWCFTVNVDLQASGLQMPKPDKNENGIEGSFLMNAERCARTADLIETLSRQ